MEKRTVFILAMILVIGALATAAFRIVAPPSDDFDGQQWRFADTDADYASRYAMIPSLFKLRADGVLATQEKTLNLLGKPDWESDDRTDTWEYRLGAVEGSSDMRVLEIAFDATNHVTGMRMKQEVQSRRADPQ